MTQSTQGQVSEARLRSVLDTAVDGIIVMDARGRIVLYNRACEHLFGYSAEEAIGQGVGLIMPRDEAAAHAGFVRRFQTTRQPRIIGIGREVRGRHKDGTVFPIELSVGEATTAEGQQFIGIMRDLRPRKEVERRVSQLQEQLVGMARVNAMDEMGAAIAHELNQPLTALMLYLKAAERRLEAGESAQADAISAGDIVLRALKEAERASAIIQHMRGLVEKREPERQKVDMPALVEDALGLVMLGAWDNKVEIHRVEPADLPAIHVDPVQIQQILVNVLRNGLEAARNAPERWIAIEMAHADNFITVAMEDSGSGIPEAARSELFKAFSSTKRSGLGLGLAISRSLAQNHGGDLTVEDGRHGSGARFLLKLPSGTP